MSAQIEPQEITMSDLITYSVTDAALAELHSKYIGLRVLDAEDEEGYAVCKEARKIVRDTRLGVEERRKELKAESLAFGKAVDAEAKRIFGKIEAVENHLVEQLKIVDDEKKRREEEAIRVAKERINSRIASLQACKAEFAIDEITGMSDDDFKVFLIGWQNYREAELRKEAAEKLRLEQLEAERAAQDALLAAERERVRQLEAEALKMRQEAFERETAERIRKLEEDAVAACAVSFARATAWVENPTVLPAWVENPTVLPGVETLFPTLETAWAEIKRLRKLLADLSTDAGRILEHPAFNLGNGGTHPAVDE